MKIKSLQLKNFKRFTDLALQGIPENAKLVLLIGSNGSGKSSVFDAFNYLEGYISGSTNSNLFSYADRDRYYSKKASINNFEIVVTPYNKPPMYVDKHGKVENLEAFKKYFYGRTSFRQIPVLTRKSLGASFDIRKDSDKPAAFIDRDSRFENDLEHLFGRLLKEFFRTNDDKSEIKEKVINPINDALERIFSKENGTKLKLVEIIPPLEGKVAQLNFKKGENEFHYNQLSAGEKEVFNILINLVARGEYYIDTIFFFDEIDLHLNTKLQYNFLKEIVENWIPENCQFWTASHSLGFIQYAKESEQGVIFDFDDYDFDYPKALSPEPKDNADIYEIAVNKEILPSLFKNYEIYFVENKDRIVYGELNIANTLFVQENGKSGVYHKVKNGDFAGIIDRDFLSDSDIEEVEKQYATLKVLKYYSIENYLFHPDNLYEYYSSKGNDFDRDGYIKNLLYEKNKIREELIRKIALTRTAYPFFKEPEHNGKPNQRRFSNFNENFEQVAEIEKYLNSDQFDGYFKVFPMKDYGTSIKERQNLSKVELAKTKWFKNQIEELIQ